MGIPIDINYGRTYILRIAATQSHCEGPRQTRHTTGEAAR